MPAQQLSWLVNSASEASAGLQRVYDILDLVPEIKSPPGAVSLATMQGAVYFDRVSFAYHGEKGEALHDVHLEVAPNQIVALIGPTGSGKTTLVNLIPRFYDVTSGALRIDELDVRQVTQASLREQIGIVPQETMLFGGTIRENILYGRLGASEDEMIAAAEAANAHSFIARLPHGYETIVGERGQELFVPNQSGTIIPADQTRQMLGGGSGPTVHIQNATFANDIDLSAFARELSWRLS